MEEDSKDFYAILYIMAAIILLVFVVAIIIPYQPLAWAMVIALISLLFSAIGYEHLKN